MKIAIASENKSEISEHFGRAKGFTIFEIIEGTAKNTGFRENFGKSNGNCGSCNHKKMISNIKDCDFVISHGMGKKIFDDLKENNIQAIVTEEKSIQKAVEKFLKNSLKNRLDRLH